MTDSDIVKKAIQQIINSVPEPWIQHNTTAYHVAMAAVALAREEEKATMQKPASDDLNLFVSHDVSEALYKY